MPSFLSRLLGRKKGQDPELSPDDQGYPPPLLEGKFEAISPNVSPSAAFFTDPGAAQIRGDDKLKDKESPFYLFRARPRPSPDVHTPLKAAPDVPHLSLNLPVTKVRGRALDVVFEAAPETSALLDDDTIGEKRLTPHEALSLVRSCSQVIVERGLETLGVMHPHWHSASPEIQRRLISLYLLSLTSASFKDTASLTATMAFESELHYVRSPQDVAAVLRWGLRHLRLDGDSFGNESGDWTWYHTFAEAERAASYPPEAFSKLLIPQLPAAHTELLLATLDIISSLSTRGDANGSSGSKLSKLFGLWLLISERSVQGDDWTAFYDRWARAGRILEHLFLARIRNDAPNLPRRLTDLIEHYPYDHVSDFPKDDLLPRPRFSTRQYDALFVRLDTEYAAALKPKSHPLRLIADALRAECTNESVTAEDDSLWDAIKKASLIFDASEGPSDAAPAEPIPIFSNVFSDETIRLLSLIPVDVSDKDKSAPTFVLQSPISLGLQRSFSLPETPLSPVSADHGPPPSVRQAHVAPILIANNSTAPTTASPDTPADWLQFSSQGFGAIPDSRDFIAKLWDDDIEVTVPPAPLSRKSSRRAHSRRSSVDTARMSVPPLPAPPPPPISKTTLIAKIKLDEAFIDFWADSLLDPISKRWPPFVLCQLKPLPSSATFSPPTPTWLVIEQRLVSLVPVSPVKEEAETTVPPARPRASSPRPSLRTESSRLSAAFSIASKRFTFFTGGSNDPKSPQDRTARLPQVGEFGEVANVIGDDALAKESKEEAGAKVDVGVGAALVVDAAALTVAGAAAAAVAATHEEIAQTPKENVFSAPVLEIARSELAGVSVPKADLVKDEPRHAATTQNGPAQDIHQDEEHRELDLETAATQGPGGADAAMVSSVDSKPVETYSQLPVTEAEITQLEQETVPVVPQMAGRAKAAPPEPETIPLESAPVLDPPAPEPSTAPVVEYATPDEEKDATFVVSEPVILDGPPLEEPKFSGGPPAETMQVPAESTPVQVPVPVPPVAAFEEPVAEETVVSQVTILETVIGPEATVQDSPADEATPAGPDYTPADGFVLVSETSKAALVEAEEPPSEVASATRPEDDISTGKNTQVVPLDDSEPVIVEKPSATEFEPIPADDTALATQVSPFDEGPAADSVDAAEVIPHPEEPALEVVEPAIEEDAPPIVIPVNDETFSGRPDDVKAADFEQATEPALVPNDTALPVPENADFPAAQSADETALSDEERDAEHAHFTIQSAKESLITPQVQDAIIEEHPVAEESRAISEVFPGKSIMTGDLAASQEDETCAASAESAIAESTPEAELGPVGTSILSGISPQEMPEGSAPEPLTAISNDSVYSPTNGFAEPAIAHAEASIGEPDSTVTTTGYTSITGPVNEASALKAEAGIIPESQASNNNSERALAAEELSTPVHKVLVAVPEEPVPPTGAETHAEALTCAVQEPASTTDEAASVAADHFTPPPVSAAQEPAPEEATAPEVAETIVEAPAPVPAESDPVPEEATLVATNASVANPVPAIQEPAAKEASAQDHTPTKLPAPVPEEPTSLEEAVPDTDDVPVLEEPTLIVEGAATTTGEGPADSSPMPDEPTRIVENASPATNEAPVDPPPAPEVFPEEAAPVTTEVSVPKEPNLIFDETAPAPSEAPADPAPVPGEPTLIVEDASPATIEARADPIPVPEEPVPLVEETASGTNEGSADSAPVLKESAPYVEAAPAADEATANPALALEELAPLPEEVVPVTDEAPVPAEPTLIVEAAPATSDAPADHTPVPEEPVPILEDTATPSSEAPPEPTPVPEEPDPLLEEVAPDIDEAPVDPASVPEEPIPYVEEAAPAVDEAPTDPVYAPEDPASLAEEAAPVTNEAPLPPEPILIVKDAAPATSESSAGPAPVPEELDSLPEAEPASNKAPSDPAPEEPTPLLEAVPGASEAPADPTPAPEEPTTHHEEVVPITSEAPPASVPLPNEPASITQPEIAALVAETLAPVSEKGDTAPEQFAPDHAGTPTPGEPALVVEEPEENSAPLPEDPAPTADSAADPTTDETPAKTGEHGAEGFPAPEPVAAVADENASAAEETTTGWEGTGEAEPAAEGPLPAAGALDTQESVARSNDDATVILTEPLSEPRTAASELEAFAAALTSSDAADNASSEHEREIEIEPESVEPVAADEEAANVA